ncbi:MAG TPA: N-acetylglucosamine-6-phosphate deacetylase [Bacillales bacterium]|nr:N-acetylglucosamine-6-phosphate deacetylase [Bacillales bacterium]
MAITKVRIATENEIIPDGTVFVKDGKIVSVENHSFDDLEDWKVIDGHGQLLIPGMIDVHIHGANGYDMMDGSSRSIEEVSRVCAQTGCTSFLATSVTSSIEDLLGMIQSVKQVEGNEPGAHIVGIHLEGPYLNHKKKGMQNERYLRHPDIEEMKAILDEADPLVQMVTLAPELPGGMEMIEFLKEKGIVVAIAHSDITYEQAKEAFSLGASHVTHCFNAMSPIHHRSPGLVVAAFEEQKVSLQAIVDYVHLHPAIVRMMYRMVGFKRMVLITDALQAMGLGDGEYQFGGHDVQVVNGVAQLKDGTLASSTVTMNEALRKTVECGVPLWEAIMMATQVPAAVLDLPEKGRISPGADADLVLLNDHFDVRFTMVDGRFI